MARLLNILISQTRKIALASAIIPSPLTLPPLYNKSRLLGEFTVSKETGDPSAPLEAIDDILTASVAITRNGVTLITATDFMYYGNRVTFEMLIDSELVDTLLDASDDEERLDVVLEIRITTAQEEDTVLREALPLFAVDTDIPDAPHQLITFEDSDSVAWEQLV